MMAGRTPGRAVERHRGVRRAIKDRREPLVSRRARRHGAPPFFFFFLSLSLSLSLSSSSQRSPLKN